MTRIYHAVQFFVLKGIFGCDLGSKFSRNNETTYFERFFDIYFLSSIIFVPRKRFEEMESQSLFHYELYHTGGMAKTFVYQFKAAAAAAAAQD